MKAREYLEKNHPTAPRIMDSIGKEIDSDFTSGIVDVMEEYHTARSKEEAEERAGKAAEHFLSVADIWKVDGRGIKYEALGELIKQTIHIASGKEES